MARKPTERTMKQHPKAVVFLTTLRTMVPEVPVEGFEMEWFHGDSADSNGSKAVREYFDQVRAFDVEDVKEHNDFAFLVAEVMDTSTDPLTLGRVEAAPDTKETKAWVKAVKEDPTLLYAPSAKKPEEKAATPSRKVKPRAKSAAAQKATAVKPPTRAQKAAAAKETLAKKAAAKKVPEKKSETGDIVVKKAATDPNPEPKVS